MNKKSHRSLYVGARKKLKTHLKRGEKILLDKIFFICVEFASRCPECDKMKISSSVHFLARYILTYFFNL